MILDGLDIKINLSEELLKQMELALGRQILTTLTAETAVRELLYAGIEAKNEKIKNIKAKATEDFRALAKIVSHFYGLTDADVRRMVKWLTDKGIDVSSDKRIADCHYEQSWEGMFNYLYDGSSPFQIAHAYKNPEDYDDVFICDYGGCVYFYNLDCEKEVEFETEKE